MTGNTQLPNKPNTSNGGSIRAKLGANCPVTAAGNRLVRHLRGRGSAAAAVETTSAAPPMTMLPFDIRHAIQMASKSFEAQLEPTNKEGFRFRDRYEDDTTAYYLSCPFVVEHFDAVVRVVVHSAANLKATDGPLAGDPYVIMRCGESLGRTSVAPKTLNPEWTGEEHFVWVSKAGSGPGAAEPVLRLSVWDKDYLEDDALGKASVALSALRDGTEETMELELEGENGVRGVLKVTIEKMLVAALEAPGGGGKQLKRLQAAVMHAEPRVSKNSMMPAATAGAAAAASGMSDGEVTHFLSDTAFVQSYYQEAARIMKIAWDKLTATLWSADAHLEPVVYLTSAKTDTDLWIHRHTGCKRVVVAFRGTEIYKRGKDVWVDADIRFRRWPLGSPDERVHKGFKDAWDSVSQRVRTMVDMATGADSDWQVWITGHSLGAAVATLCAAELAATLPNDVHLYNFGSPRVGNADFGDALNRSALRSCWRVRTADDVIPRVPPTKFGFRHIANGVALRPDGRLQMFDSRAVVLGAGIACPEDALVPEGDARKDDEGLSGEDASILEVGFNGHFQPSYLDKLCEVLEGNDSDAVRAVVREARDQIRKAEALVKEGEEKEKEEKAKAAESAAAAP